MMSMSDETPDPCRLADTKAGAHQRIGPLSVQLLGILRRRGWAFVPCVLTCYAWVAVPRLKPAPPPQYRATAKLLVREEPIWPCDSRLYIIKSYTNDLSYLEAQCAALRSRGLTERVVKQLGLAGRAGFESGDQEALLRQFASRLSVRPMRASAGLASYEIRVLDVSFTAAETTLAAEVANAICDTFIAREHEMDVADVDRALAYLRGKQDEAIEELAAADEAARTCEAETASGETEKEARAHPKGRLVRLSALKGQAEAKRQFLKSLVSQAAELPLSQCASEARSRIVSRAVAPATPLTVRPKRSLGDGLAMGVIIGLALIAAFELLDHTIRGAQGVHEFLDTPLLGVLGPANSSGEDGARRPIVAGPGSGVAESFRRLRANLLFSEREVGWRTLAVVSTRPAEGGSFVLAGLAAAMGESGKRVLVVDSDLRRPALHTAFALDAPVGLVEVLRGEAELEEAVLETAAANVSVLPCGACPANASELLTSEAMSSIAKQAADTYDVVLYDTPSLSEVSDGLVVAGLSDATLFVVEEGQTGRYQARQCLDELGRTGASVVGVVLNARPITWGRAALSSMGLASWFPPRGTASS